MTYGQNLPFQADNHDRNDFTTNSQVEVRLGFAPTGIPRNIIGMVPVEQHKNAAGVDCKRPINIFPSYHIIFFKSIFINKHSSFHLMAKFTITAILEQEQGVIWSRASNLRRPQIFIRIGV